MEENKVLISLDRYNELILAEENLEILKSALFDEEKVRLGYDKKHLIFEPSHKVVKALLPLDYRHTLENLVNTNGDV
jgi:hypothetical protein